MTNILKMMEESCKVTITANEQLYFEETFSNNDVASKFIVNWICSPRFRKLVEPVSSDFEIPDHFESDSENMEEAFNNIREVPMLDVDCRDIKYDITKSNSYIIIGFENENHEMIFG